MTNRTVIAGLFGVLIAGLAFLGLEARTLSAEAAQLSSSPAAANAKPDPQSTPSGLTRPDDPWMDPAARWDPFAEMARMQQQMERMFDQSLAARPLPAAGAYNLSTDVKDTKDRYVINMDLPGMDKNNINVEVKNNTLLVSGERKKQDEEKGTNFYKQERSFGYFSQSLPLPDDANVEAINVQYDKGVLKIEIPKLAKAKAEEKVTKIKVN